MNNSALNKSLAYIAFFCLAILCVVMGTATIAELYHGSEFVQQTFYNSWWFILLWGIAAITATIYFVRTKKYKSLYVAGIHLSFILILAGAFATHITSQQGYLHLRNGETSDTFITKEGVVKKLPFQAKLIKFQIEYYQGSDVAADYKSIMEITKSNNETTRTSISMNKILKEAGIRLYQLSYDEDCEGSTFLVNYDPLGMPITYSGYILLFLSLILWLFSRKGMMRKALHHINLKPFVFVAVLLLGCQNAQAQISIPQAQSDKFGELLMNYEGRVTAVETFAKDFVLKITDGETSYKGLDSKQILIGWILFPHRWEDEDIVSIKDRKLRKFLGLDRRTSYSKIAYAIAQCNSKEKLTIQAAVGEKTIRRLSEKLDLIYSVEHGTLLKMFPYKIGKHTKWFSYMDTLPASISKRDADFIHLSMTRIYGAVLMQKTNLISGVVNDIKDFQVSNGGSTLPSRLQMNSEHILNKVPFTNILFKINLLAGILAFFGISLKRDKTIQSLCVCLSILTCVVLLGVIVLRTIVSEHIPLSNGYETIIAVAWLTQLASIILSKRIPLLNAYGLIGAGFILLVASLQAADPKITPLMPVLASPLLAIHVSVIMIAYAFLTLSFLVSLSALILGCKKNGELVLERMRHIVKLLLPPAVATLGIGIFIGAIWANISWGSYWSWDSKEVWSLITFIIYGISFHENILKKLSKPYCFHTYIVLAYLTVLMTYFGVNMILPGMHSYSGM